MQKIRWMILGLCALLVAASAARATTYQAVENGDWNTPATWGQASAYPSVSTDVERIANFTVSVAGASETASGGAITIGYNISTSNYSGTLSISAGTLDLGGNLDDGYAGNVTGTVNQSGGTIALSGTSKLYVGVSSTSDATSNSTSGALGNYNFSGGVLSQGSTSTATVGEYVSPYYASNGTFTISGNAAGSSIALGYLSVGNYDNGAGTGTGSAGTLAFAIGSSGVTPINASRLFLADSSTGGTADLAISLLSAPPVDGNGNPLPVMLVELSGSNSEQTVGTFAGLAQGSPVSAVAPGGGTYSWDITYTGDANLDGGTGIDVGLIDGSYTAPTPEPMATAPLCLGMLAFLRRPARRREQTVPNG